MKRIFAVMLTLLMGVVLVACGGTTEEGDYKPGLYLGYTDGHRNTYAYVYVDAEGFINDVFIDTVYTTTDDDEDIATTKMSLDYGQGYDMRNDGLWWYEQVDLVAQNIVENQGIIDYDLIDGDFDEDGDDVISGVTITVDGYLEAVGNALSRAELAEDESPSDFDVPSYDEGLDLTPGIHFGYTDGNENTLGVIAVNEEGNIVYAIVDTVYLKTDDEGPLAWESRGNDVTGIATTKMSLDHGEGYDMRNDGYSWLEQTTMLMDDVVANQGIIDYDIVDGDFDEDGDDVVAGVTITVDGYLEAIANAIAQAE